MQMNFDSTAVAESVMALPPHTKRVRTRFARQGVPSGVRIQLDRSDALENAVWAVLAFVALFALAVSLAV
jgi:hypothetical protein